MSKVEHITMHTEHFTAAVDMHNRTFTLYGDFRETVVHAIPDNPWQGSILGGVIEELRDLENDIRMMVGFKEVAVIDCTESGNAGGESPE